MFNKISQLLGVQRAYAICSSTRYDEVCIFKTQYCGGSFALYHRHYDNRTGDHCGDTYVTCPCPF